MTNPVDSEYDTIAGSTMTPCNCAWIWRTCARFATNRRECPTGYAPSFISSAALQLRIQIESCVGS